MAPLQRLRKWNGEGGACLRELVLELVLDEAAATGSPAPSSVPPLSPLPLEPTGDCGVAEAKRRRVKARRSLRRCIVGGEEGGLLDW